MGEQQTIKKPTGTVAYRETTVNIYANDAGDRVYDDPLTGKQMPVPAEFPPYAVTLIHGSYSTQAP